MGKIDKTRVGLRQEKGELAKFQKFLPTLELKQKQLMQFIHNEHQQATAIEKEFQEYQKGIQKWVAVFNEPIDTVLSPKYELSTATENVAGINIPVFREILFAKSEINLSQTPLWVDEGLIALQKIIIFQTKLDILKKRLELINKELTTTTQRINLFEKKMIPEHKKNIGKIKIALGDQETNAVVQAKIAKGKIEKKRKTEVL